MDGKEMITRGKPNGRNDGRPRSHGARGPWFSFVAASFIAFSVAALASAISGLTCCSTRSFTIANSASDRPERKIGAVKMAEAIMGSLAYFSRGRMRSGSFFIEARRSRICAWIVASWILLAGRMDMPTICAHFSIWRFTTSRACFRSFAFWKSAKVCVAILSKQGLRR